MEYFTVYTNAIDKFYEELDKFVLSKKKDVKYVIFGCNIISGMIIDYIEKKGFIIESIIDNNPLKQGTYIYGKRVYSPEIYKSGFRTDVVFLIASSFVMEMSGQLKSYGYSEKQIIKLIDLQDLMSDYSYNIPEKMREMSNGQIKKCQLQLLKKLDDICNKYNLKYYMIFGTLLGAVRHNGYIPWDDDIDIGIPVKDFIKLTNILNKEQCKYKILSQFDTNFYFGSAIGYMVDLDTYSCVNKFPIQFTSGVNIEIFPLFGIPDDGSMDKYLQEAKKLEADCFNTLYCREENENNVKKFNEFLLKYDYDKCDKVGNYFMISYKKHIFEKNIFDKFEYLPFEDIELRAPKQYDSYLQQVYGDYMKLPPIEQRKGSHFCKSFFKL